MSEPTFPHSTDPVSAITRPDGTTFAHSREHGRAFTYGENVMGWGAKGDGTTDDSAAIQAAMDYTGDPRAGADKPAVVFFPAGVYRIGTPLTLRGAQRLVGAGGFYTGGTRASVLACTGSATQIFKTPAGGVSNLSMEYLQFAGKNFIDNGSSATPTDTAIYMVDTGANSGWFISHCIFNAFVRAIDLETNQGQWLIQNVEYTDFYNAPVDLRSAAFQNYNLWLGCNFQLSQAGVSEYQVPSVDLSSPLSSSHQRNTFLSCRWESNRRQAIRIGEHDYISLRDCYFEGTNLDNIANPRDPTQKLPAVDLVRISPGTGVKHFRADNCFFIELNVVAIGSTDLSGGRMKNGMIDQVTGTYLDLGIFEDVVRIGGEWDGSGSFPNTSFTFTTGNTNRIEIYNGQLYMDGLRIHTGSGSPNSVLTAPIGSLYLRTDGSTGTALYMKESGTGNTGWTGMKTATDSLVTLTDGGTVTVDASLGHSFYLDAGGSRTFAQPTNGTAGQAIDLLIANATGGAITTTWGNHWHFAGGSWTDPGNGKFRAVRFMSHDGTHFWEVGRTSADMSP